jgi:hypothetical protein
MTNRRCADALEQFQGRLSPVYVPPRLPQPLAQFLHDLVKKSPRYQKMLKPPLTRERQLRTIAALARHVREHGEPDGLSFYEEISAYFDQLDFEADLQYSPAEELGWDKEPRSPGGFRESQSGLILPGD